MQTIRRGTTPTIHFTTTVEETDVGAIYITFEQSGEIICEKDDTAIVWDSTGLSVVLSQEETLKFAPGLINVQIRVRLTSTLATATQILPLMVENVIKGGVI